MYNPFQISNKSTEVWEIKHGHIHACTFEKECTQMYKHYVNMAHTVIMLIWYTFSCFTVVKLSFSKRIFEVW
jgi:hypothetical protein